MAFMPDQRLYTAEDLLAPGFDRKHCELWDGPSSSATRRGSGVTRSLPRSWGS